jgi:hypothetical protein
MLRPLASFEALFLSRMCGGDLSPDSRSPSAPSAAIVVGPPPSLDLLCLGLAADQADKDGAGARWVD